MLLADDLIDRLVARMTGEVEPIDRWPDEDLEPQPLADPVSRISQEVAESASSIPSSLVSDPFDDDIDIDAMTATIREREQGRKTFKQSTHGSSGSFRAADTATGLPKPTTQQFVKRLLAKNGLSYEWGYEGQRDPVTGERAWDCSGLIVDVMNSFGIKFPRMVSGTLIQHAKPMSLKKAINTRGALLWTEGHIAISLGNGKTIEARGEDYGVVIGKAEGRFTKGGMLPELEVVAGKAKPKGKRPVTSKEWRIAHRKDPDDLVPKLASITNPTAVFGTVMDEIEEPIVKMREARGRTEPPRKGILGQLYAGFMDAGRKDLAKMVFTKDFKMWLGQESGMNPEVVSPANNQGMPNGGLFQFWFGHDWAKKYFKDGSFTASPYEQAMLAATHFDLTPEDIKRYADQIRSGSYKGWG